MNKGGQALIRKSKAQGSKQRQENSLGSLYRLKEVLREEDVAINACDRSRWWRDKEQVKEVTKEGNNVLQKQSHLM